MCGATGGDLSHILFFVYECHNWYFITIINKKLSESNQIVGVIKDFN